MSYVDEIYERVVAQNPGEPEFHQAVKEVLDSLKLVIDANEEKVPQSGHPGAFYRAGAHYFVPRAVGGRSGKCAGQ